MRFIKARVVPDSKKDEVVRKGEDMFEIFVRAEPERGEANHAVRIILGRELDIDPDKLRIVKGHHSRSKIFTIWE